MTSQLQTSLTLFGSPPWGLAVAGGKELNQPLVVSRVTPQSLAARSGVQVGDVLIAANNQYVSELTQDECEAVVAKATGSLHLVLVKGAAQVTELPGGQVQVEGDRTVYTKLKDTQQKLSKFNRSARPFGAPEPSVPAPTEEKKKAEVGFRSVAFKPGSQSQSTAARGEPDGVNSAPDKPSYSGPKHFGSSN